MVGKISEWISRRCPYSNKVRLVIFISEIFYFFPSPCQVKEIASKMLGNRLITKQTGEAGKPCNSVMIMERKFPRREFYFAFALDRNYGGVVLIASSRGGINIEDVAKQTPDAIIYQTIDSEKGFTKEIADWILRRVGITDQPAHACKMLMKLYELFIKKDCLLAEINPYVEDVCLNYFPLDVKLIFDDNADFRQSEIFEKRDESQEELKELTASKLGMSYVSLDGSIGLMVNGAGLAMATVDILSYYGGEAANFLDIGTMSSPVQITEAVKVIMMDPKVRTIFVNIFGGMNKCDAVAEGLLKAIRELDIKIPIIARIEGNNYEKGRKMIQEAKTNIITSDSFDDAAAMAVRCSKIMKLADCGNLNAALSMNLKCECEPAVDDTEKPFYPPVPPASDNKTPPKKREW